MIFTQNQIDEVMRIIDFQHIFFCAGNVSTLVLSDRDKVLLKSFGIDYTKITEGFTPFQQLYYFGRLAAALDDQTGKVDYNNFKKYIQRGQYNPLTTREEKTLRYLERNVYNYVTKQRDIVQTQVKTLFDEENSRDEFSTIINETLKEGVRKRESKKNLVLELGERTGKWEIDLGRIVETEGQNAFLHGKMDALIERYGKEKLLFYKEVYPGACKHCIRLYLTNGIGSQPRLFTYEELVGNGDNFHLKPKDWKAVLGTTHPFCYDNQTEVLTNEGWKFFNDLNKSEKFLSVDLETGTAEWVQAVKWLKVPYKGNLISFQNKNFDLVISPNHHHVIRTRACKKLRFVETKDLPKNSEFLRHIPNWIGHSSNFEFDGIKYNTEKFIQFLGFYLSEGSAITYTDKRGCESNRIHIAQSEEKYLDEIYDICSSLFNTASKCKGYVQISAAKYKELWIWLNKFGKANQKYVPKEIKEATQEQINLFLNTYCKGDGSFVKGRVWDGYQCKDSRLFYTSSSQMAADLGELMLKIERCPSYKFKEPQTIFDPKRNKSYTQNQGMWVINETTSKYVHKEFLKETQLEYDDFIYDVELEKYHTLIVRRNANVVISGNCRCHLQSIDKKDEIWDEEKKEFITKRSVVNEAKGITGDIIVTVGDRLFKI